MTKKIKVGKHFSKSIIYLVVILAILLCIYFYHSTLLNSSDTKTDDIQAVIDKMTIDEKIGQLVIGSYDNISDIPSIVSVNKLGGVILYKKNITTISQTIADINTIKTTNDENKIPMFIAVDQEGGSVTRLPSEMGTFESAMSIGDRNDLSYAYDDGVKIGQSLKQLGFNLDFAPVLDIFSNPLNTVIADRAYGTTPDRVSKIGIEVLKGINSENIISSVKHFPGHGDTEIDSHVGLPIVNKSLAELKSFEFKPFIAAINNDVDMIMTAHIILSKIDSLPATLSSKVVNDILRVQLGYKGVIITDDMSMGAIANNYTIAKASVMAINAGCDIVLVKGVQNSALVINELKKAVNDGTITEDRINESIYRILAVKNKYKL